MLTVWSAITLGVNDLLCSENSMNWGSTEYLVTTHGTVDCRLEAFVWAKHDTRDRDNTWQS